MWHAGSQLPNQGSNPPAVEALSLNHWTTREVHQFFNWAINSVSKLNYFVKWFALLPFSFSRWLVWPDWGFSQVLLRRGGRNESNRYTEIIDYAGFWHLLWGIYHISISISLSICLYLSIYTHICIYIYTHVIVIIFKKDKERNFRFHSCMVEDSCN